MNENETLDRLDLAALQDDVADAVTVLMDCMADVADGVSATVAVLMDGVADAAASLRQWYEVLPSEVKDLYGEQDADGAGI